MSVVEELHKIATILEGIKNNQPSISKINISIGHGRGTLSPKIVSICLTIESNQLEQDISVEAQNADRIKGQLIYEINDRRQKLNYSLINTNSKIKFADSLMASPLEELAQQVE